MTTTPWIRSDDEARALREELDSLDWKEMLIRSSWHPVHQILTEISRKNLDATNRRTLYIEIIGAVSGVKSLARGLRALVKKRRTVVETSRRVLRELRAQGKISSPAQRGRLGGNVSSYNRGARTLRKDTLLEVAQEVPQALEACRPSSRTANLSLVDGLAQELRMAQDEMGCHLKQLEDDPGLWPALGLIGQILELIDPFSTAAKVSERAGEQVERWLDEIGMAFARGYADSLNEIHRTQRAVRARLQELDQIGRLQTAARRR